MQNHSGNISMEDAMRFAASPAGRQLLALLQQSHGVELQEAMEKASAGDMRSAQSVLSSLLSSPQVRALLQQMEG